MIVNNIIMNPVNDSLLYLGFKDLGLLFTLSLHSLGKRGNVNA
mgnify:CR=1